MASKQGLTTKSKAGPGSTSGHRAFKPILPCGNKLLQQRWDQTYYDEHRRLVKTAKPMVDTKAPEKRNHVIAKWKKKQVQKEQDNIIDRDNHNLLGKMHKIMNTQGCVDHRNTYEHHSLNLEQRQREMVRVARENGEFLGRLEKVEPIYKVSDWVEDWQRKEALTSMITSFPDGPPHPHPPATPSSTHITSPTASPSHTTFPTHTASTHPTSPTHTTSTHPTSPTHTTSTHPASPTHTTSSSSGSKSTPTHTASPTSPTNTTSSASTTSPASNKDP